jgi:GMP reductase
MRIEEDIKLDYKDVLIRPKRSTLVTRKEVDISRDYKFRHTSQTFHGIPIIAANMDGVGTIDMARTFEKHGQGLTVALTKHYSEADLISFYAKHGNQSTWYSIGTNEKDLKKLKTVLSSTKLKKSQKPNKLCIDVANGYSQYFIDFLKKMRALYPDMIIMAGNVVTGEMTEELILCGADIVKVGIGPGSVCTTRKMTGVGYPQLSAVIECADAAHGLGGLICADGGCTVPGDVAKAFGAGADFVMLGGMLAGHDQSESELIEHNGEKFIQFYGMSSSTAMKKHTGGVADYRASEGKTVRVKYRGNVLNTLQDILGGLRSTCTYVGAKRLKELSKRTSFIRVTQQINNIFGSD